MESPQLNFLFMRKKNDERKRKYIHDLMGFAGFILASTAAQMRESIKNRDKCTYYGFIKVHQQLQCLSITIQHKDIKVLYS
jgi:hypothetical protein